MRNLWIRSVPIALILLSMQMPCQATLNMRGLTSYFRASAGGNFVANQSINGYNGKLIRDAGGIISGNAIVFSRGLFEDQGNDLLLTASLDLGLTGSEIQLTGAAGGANLLRAQPGTVYQNFLISGQGNRIEGSPLMTQNITLSDVNTSVTFAMQTPLNSYIVLNNGSVFLEADLTFADFMRFSGSGTVNASNHKIIFGGKPLTFTSPRTFQDTSEMQLWSDLNLSGVSTFVGTNVLNGNGNAIIFNPGGEIFVAPNSSLYLTDVVLKNFSTGNLSFADTTGTIYLANVTFELAQTVTSTLGNIYVNGPATAVVPGYNWYFSNNAVLTINDFTFWTDRAGSSIPGFIIWAGPSNLSLINSGTIKGMDSTFIANDYLESQITNLQFTTYALTASVAQLELCTGCTYVSQVLSPSTLSTVETFNGAAFLNGNGNVFTFTTGGQFNIASGCTLYLSDIVLKNVQNNSFVFNDATGTIVMSNVTVEISQDITTTIGNIYVSGPTTWVIKDHNWTFNNASVLTIDDIILWGEMAGATTRGNILFGAPANLVIRYNGTIRYR